MAEINPDFGFFRKVEKLRKGERADVGKGRSCLTWVPVIVTSAEVTTDGIFHIHYNDGQPHVLEYRIAWKDYYRWRSLKDERWFEFLDTLLKTNKAPIRIRKYPAVRRINLKVTERLYKQKCLNAKICGQNLSQHCIDILEGKHPRAALTEADLKLMEGINKLRSDIQLMTNAIFGSLKSVPKEQLFAMVIEGRDFSWWRKRLEKCLEFIDNFIKNKEYGYQS